VTVLQSASGGLPSPIAAVAVIAVAVYAVNRVGISLWPLGRGGGGGNGTAGGVADTAGGAAGRVVGVLTDPVVLAAGMLVALVLVLSGTVPLPAGVSVQGVVALELLAVYFVLRELEAYSFPLFAVVAGVITVLALSSLGEPIIGSVLNSEVGVILVIGALYLGYRWLRQRGNDNQTIVVQAEEGGES
jgi:hypothetical protein